MRLIVDANIVLSAIFGRSNRFGRAIDAGIELFIPEAQLREVVRVLVRKTGVDPVGADEQVELAMLGLEVLEMQGLEAGREAALARLGARGKPDWPVLAAAMLLDAQIWSDDRDFFGVGVAVWWRDTIEIAIAEAAVA